MNDVVGVYVFLDGNDGVKRVGNTSMDIEVWLRRGSYWCAWKIIEVAFTFVAIDEDSKPRMIPEINVILGSVAQNLVENSSVKPNQNYNN